MQSNSKILEPFDFASDVDITMPSIFRETFVIDDIIRKSDSIQSNYAKYIEEKKKFNYDSTNKVYDNPDINGIDTDNPYNDDILDDKGYRRYRPKLVDAQKEDGQTMLIQQNSMYIIGMITTATLLITAIMLAR